jgi:hypothetical protein
MSERNGPSSVPTMAARLLPATNPSIGFRARSRSVEELLGEQRASRERLLHLPDEGVSMSGIPLALEQRRPLPITREDF